MNVHVDLAPNLKARLDAIADRLNLSPSQLISDALENGRSLEWQEQFLRKVADGIDAADAGAFASDDEIERIRNRHRPA